MIWIWITAAVLISWLLCQKKIAWQHYIWIFVPIEMYGITIAGATFKPYMLFGIIIIFYNSAAKIRLKLPRSVLSISFLLILSDCINGLIIGSIMQHFMIILILIIACGYLNSQDWVINFNDISIVTIATTIGYGVVFAIAYIMTAYNISIPDVYTADRYSVGMVVKSVLTGFGNTVTIRLRGFCIDPNSAITTLIPGAAFGLANILYRKENKANSILAVAFYFLVTYYSGSRMALVSSLVMVAVMFVIGYRQTKNRGQWVIIGTIAILGLTIFESLNQNRIISEIAYELNSFFNSRASLTDDAGRITIWRSNLQYLIDNNKFWFGVGQNQIYNFTMQGKACHNTWLEWICGVGIFLGTYIDLYFFTAPLTFLKKAKRSSLVYGQEMLPIILAYVIVMTSILTIDNITNSVLIILAILFRYGIPSRR